eukprot:10796309-Alexandrium_andersonii.AAC.1
MSPVLGSLLPLGGVLSSSLSVSGRDHRVQGRSPPRGGRPLRAGPPSECARPSTLRPRFRWPP